MASSPFWPHLHFNTVFYFSFVNLSKISEITIFFESELNSFHQYLGESFARVNMLLKLFSIVGMIALLSYPFIAIRQLPAEQAIGVIVPFYLLLCGILVFIYIKRSRFQRIIAKLAEEMELDKHFTTLEDCFLKTVEEIRKKQKVFSLVMFETKIKNKEELLKNLENTVNLAYRYLKAESAELALFDPETKTYHTSYVMGNPSGKHSQAMLNAAAAFPENKQFSNLIIQELRFAGETLGTLRVFFKKKHVVKKTERDLLSIIAVQGILAILNSSYTEELVKMKRFSDESVKVKTGFLANLSHEIRGPLSIMLNAIELVLDGLCGIVSKDQEEALIVVKQNGEHLLDLVNDVLDYAKVESHKLIPQPVVIEANELVKDIVSIMKKQADKKKHTLIFKPISEKVFFSIDKRHIRQIMINLLTNAVKYTPDGGIIELSVEKKANDNVAIFVKDNGIGIGEDDREKVFAPFERIENNYSMQQIGAGLGMALTKNLVEVNQGQIDFKSIKKTGTEFWIEFPIVTEKKEQEMDELESDTIVSGNGDSVLLFISDDNERELTAKYLKNLNFTVIIAATQSDFLEILNSATVKIMIIDNAAIDKTSENYVKNIRENPKSRKIPIILVSSKAFTFDIEKYLKEGVDLCLSKPIQLKELAHASRRLINNTTHKDDWNVRDTRTFRPKDFL